MHLPIRSSVKSQVFGRCGFTLIEVMVAAVILGLTSFSLLSLLRASDQLAIRARVNGAVASQVKARGGLLTAVSYETAAANVGTWSRGGLSGAPEGDLFPAAFALPSDSQPCVLVYGKPLPGDADYRPLAPYLETITVTVDSPGQITITYQLRWQDPLGQPTVGVPNSGSRFTDVNLTFLKYDPAYY